MTKKTRKATQARATNARRAGWWIVGMLLLAVVVVGGYRIWDKPTALPGSDSSKLIGRWVRTDGGYVLELSDPAPDGLLKAAYFNPSPINVSRAEWKHPDGRLSAFVELRDVNYPGSSYSLAYQPATDRLVGIYFQAALQQRFEVEFERTQNQK
jgi:hypothetical protein